MKFVKSFLLCILSAVLLIVSFPKYGWAQLAWVALVPMLFAINGRSPWKAWGYGLLFGFCSFFGTLNWLNFVTPAGTVVLSLYLALFPAFFAFGFSHFQKLPLITRVFILSCVWAVLEFLRSTLFTGFGWVTLGHSQSKNLLIIQIADIIGLYGISFMVTLVNLFVFETIRAVIDRKADAFEAVQRLQLIVLAILIGALGYGLWTFNTAKFPLTVKVGVVQPNIPQNIKWDESYMPSIMTDTLSLTDQVAQQPLDLILWPETSLPGIIKEHPGYLQQIQLKAFDLKTPLVMGAISQEDNRYFNAAIFIDRDGTIKGEYRKIHLVPFGEFLPLRPILGWLNKYIGLEDFKSGTDYTLFPVGKAAHRFGVLICFEDALGDIWRNFTNAGGEIFMNITNDAWFMDSKEPYMHLQGAVMQSVMNKRSLVRAANTGVSGFVDPLGRIIALAHDPAGKETFVKAFASADVPVNKTITFYTKYADVFTYLCFVCILWAIWRLNELSSRKEEEYV